MCKKINKMITSPDFNYCTFLPRCTFFNLNMICLPVIQSGSNLNQSRGYKISLESLLHRVQSCGQREFPSYRSHCPLHSFRLDPLNNQSIDVQSLTSVTADIPASTLSVRTSILLSSIGRLSNYGVIITVLVSCRHLSFPSFFLAHFVPSNSIEFLFTISL